MMFEVLMMTMIMTMMTMTTNMVAKPSPELRLAQPWFKLDFLFRSDPFATMPSLARVASSPVHKCLRAGRGGLAAVLIRLFSLLRLEHVGLAAS